MPIESDADRAVFFNPDEFGATGIFTGLTGSPSIEGHFGNGAASMLAGAGPGVQSSEPTFTCRSADLPAGVADGVVLQIAGVDYYVRDREPDGTGMTTINLEEVKNA